MANKKDLSIIRRKCGKPFNKEDQGADIKQQYCNRYLIELA